MNYTQTTIPGLASDETGYVLDNGHYVAVSFVPGRNQAPDMFAWQAMARAVNADGSAVLDQNGDPLIARTHVSCPKLSLVNGSATGADVKSAALDAVINADDGIVAERAAAEAYAA